MIIHYLKISIRNLMKYKMQSLISIFGLAVGSVCFTLSLIWIPISFWFYAVIFLGIVLLITLCIGWIVWKTSRINLAEVIKSE